MSWKSVLPKGIGVSDLSLEQCRNFKKFYEYLNENVQGPEGFKIFYHWQKFLLFFTLCCIQEKRFPALNCCWDHLQPLFGTNDFDNEWFFYCWLCCDFPLDESEDKVVIDEFFSFMMASDGISNLQKKTLEQFHSIMKVSRIGLYQEILSTSKVTKFRELFTEKPISTVRSVPHYESGEIFVTRIVTYLGDSFQIHNPQCYPSEYKQTIIDMVIRKLPYISYTGNMVKDYEDFMKLSGPYWMSCTSPNQNIDILPPDQYEDYYELCSA